MLPWRPTSCSSHWIPTSPGFYPMPDILPANSFLLQWPESASATCNQQLWLQQLGKLS